MTVSFTKKKLKNH